MSGPSPVRTGPAAVVEAARLLREGELIAFPTETVYGLGADAGNDRAVARIYAAKQRPQFNPLIVHVADPDEAAAYAVFDSRADDLATAFWPGPLTLVLPRREGARLSALVSAGLQTVTIRVPAHEVARQLIGQAGVPVAAPSANKSGRLSPTTAKHVADAFGEELSMVIAAGRCRVGVESTVIDLAGERPTLLRAGGLASTDIEAVIGPLAPAANSGPPRSPGMLEKHYAPNARLRINAHEAAPDEAYLAFGPDAFSGRGAARRLNLSDNGDLVEAAANLFAMLHELDGGGYAGIAVAPIPDSGLGAAINDRLTRAARE